MMGRAESRTDRSAPVATRWGWRLSVALLALTGLAACQDKPQTLGQRTDLTPASAGTKDGFSTPGWTAGDKTSWDEHMRARTQHGQNEYTRTSAKLGG